MSSGSNNEYNKMTSIYPDKGFISGFANETLKFLPFIDDEKLFDENLKKQKSDWIYRTLPITYQYNSLGFRCADHTELKEDYILFSGCSLTEGTALPLEHTYPYIVAKNLNLDYYNLGIAGSGPDITFHNMVLFLSLIKHKPKIVVIQWPNQSRISFFPNDSTRIRYYNNNDCDDPTYRNLLENGLMEKTNRFKRYSLINFLQNVGITKIIELSEPEFIDVNLNTITSLINLPRYDLARDLSHPGINAHIIQSEEILHLLKNM